MNSLGPIPGILSMRFVKRLRRHTRVSQNFPVTCILEVDGIPWIENQNMISLDNFLSAVISAFKDKRYKLSHSHWVKTLHGPFPNLIDIMYGTADENGRYEKSYY
jgi:hypothetical protein